MNRLVLTLFAIILLLIFWLLGCNSCRNAEIEKLKAETKIEVNPVQVVRVDTAWQTSTVQVPVFLPKIKEVIRVDSFIQFDVLPVDTAAILQDYYAKAVYQDSFKTTYGRYEITDTVSRNRIIARSISGHENLPQITRTIQTTIAEKKRVKGFLTGAVQGSYTNPVQAVGVGFMLQLKSGNAIEIGALFGRGWQPGWTGQQWQVGYKQKISFTKK